ncbi:hypothetical protein CL176_02245 [Suicoccus acidiformans]|uniref:HTH cro/C1-type domain-containing protein n=1 Tax=Suicoccus acidiformans TaxID=2036206 RepID=A0A347WIN2_9LACT|nr:helix-turn-helix transcriptional regulator [Suicoccus acidiformans]AXY24939.1 hypothetical protein CL176_02245 [Suicoccus acidiformans]
MIHEVLKQLREEAGLTQSELAHELGVDKTTVSHWEIDRNPSEEHIEELAEFYGITPEELECGVIR